MSLPHSFARICAGLALFALFAVLLATTSEAKVQPYYVVKGLAVGQVQPRVLFVLDSSGSMGFQSHTIDAECPWDECEDTSASTQSRITAARSAIQTIVSTMSDSASFGLMTFEQNGPQTSTVPPKCSDGYRFRWVTHYGYFVWSSVLHFGDYEGTWLLCDDTNRPFPYLRWDELGAGSMIATDDETGTVPASPLVSTAQVDMESEENRSRRVQWFPKFMGVRTNLNSTTDPDGSILAGTIGDWADDDAERAAEVEGQDFYYWPYVDGFPGYSVYISYPPDATYQSLGIAQENAAIEQASLYAPFYLDLASSSVPASDHGPASEDAAKAAVLSAVAPLVEGGLDAVGGSPWASVIGTIPGSAPNTNATYGHTSVASYLKFLAEVDATDACAPTSVVIITDGSPTAGEGGTTLYQRLAALRETLNVKTYVVGFLAEGPELDAMACAGAGACDGSCSTPCDDTPTKNWDTCADSTNPATACAFSADSPAALATVLSTIVADAVASELDAGPGAAVREYGVGADGAAGEGDIVQTNVRAYTDWPGWRGHVVRSLCDDLDPDDPTATAPWCLDHAFAIDEIEPTFGPCPQSRTWDAGECLQMTAWTDRRLYTHDSDGTAVAIANADGTATPAFRAELVASGAMTATDATANADAFAAFLLGKDWPSGWKLPGLANSAAVVVRRIPRYEPEVTPTVAIRDPHCSGRQLSEVTFGGLPDTLEAFARDAWDDSKELASPAPHREYQEAVLVGDDLGVLHAFQLDSGNELWGLIPRFLLANAVAEWANGAAASGQPSSIDAHLYGIAATVNQGWVFDEHAATPTWRHLGVVGLGAGGTELLALDLSHMSPSSPDGPFEILWTSEDTAVKADYDAYAGRTWARPALTYEVPENRLTEEPSPRLLITTGYPDAGAAASAGRTMMYADAITGEVLEHAVIGSDPDRFEPSFGTIVDPAVASHCISRFWGEVQEAYIADPAGRLFRWDLGNAHAADSGGTWGTSAQEAVWLPACEGSGSTCTVGSKGEPFVYGPAVTANGRIDPPGGGVSGDPPLGVDQFLVALASGSATDDTLSSTSTFHSSLYLLVDDHSTGDPHAGFDVPAGAPKLDPSALGSDDHYARIAVSDLTRTRTFTPFVGATTYDDTGKFSRATRPIRSPRIDVGGVVDSSTVGDPQGATVIEGVEVYTITYTLYEPPSGTCDPRWYDAANSTWHIDEGSTYEVRLRLTAVAGSGFDFTNGASGGAADFGGSFSTGLVLESVTQVAEGACSDGTCGPRLATIATKPCDQNAAAGSSETPTGFAVPLYSTGVGGFSAVE